MPEDKTHHSEFADFEHAYLREYISLADQKAAILLATLAGLLTYSFEKAGTGFFAASLPVHLSYLTGVAQLLLLVGCTLAALVIKPRLSSNTAGIIFFADVEARKSQAEYTDEIRRLTSNDIESEKLNHCYVLAGIASAKYRQLIGGVVCGFLGFLALVAVMAGLSLG